MLSVQNSSLERYICHYEEVPHFKARLQLVGTFAVGASFLLGGGVYLLLSNHYLPLNFGMNGNIIAAVVAGAVVTSLALVGLVIYYKMKIGEKYELSSEEEFLKALVDENTPKFLERKRGMRTWVDIHFEHMLTHTFPEENWLGMMSYLDDQFFEEGSKFDESQKENAYSVLFRQDSVRFIKNFYEMKGEEQLSSPCIAFLEPRVGKFLAEAVDFNWKHLLLSVDHHYFSQKSSLRGETRLLLLSTLREITPDRFSKACKELTGFSNKFIEFLKYNNLTPAAPPLSNT